MNCYTDGSKMNELAGAGIVVKSNPNSVSRDHREAFHLGQHDTVLQAEVLAVENTTDFLLKNRIGGMKVLINCDSQSAIRAIDSLVLKARPLSQLCLL